MDRVALYILPLQLVVFSYLPGALGSPKGRNNGLVLIVLAYYAAVHVVWLNYAAHAHFWIPYSWYPLVW